MAAAPSLHATSVASSSCGGSNDGSPHNTHNDSSSFDMGISAASSPFELVTLSMVTCRLCQTPFSMSGKLSDHCTPVMAVNPSQSIEGPYCIACAGKRDGLQSFQIDEARVALCKVMTVLQQQQQQQQQQMSGAAAHSNAAAALNQAAMYGMVALNNFQQQQHPYQHVAAAALATPSAMTTSAHNNNNIHRQQQDAPGHIITRTGSALPSSSSNNPSPTTVASARGGEGPLFFSDLESDAGLTAIAAAANNNNVHPNNNNNLFHQHQHNISAAEASTAMRMTNASSNTNKRPRQTAIVNTNYIKSNWSAEEDAMVLKAVTGSADQPFTRWSDLALQMPGRIGKQIRDRWLNHLDPKIDRTPFSREEDMTLYEAYKEHGKRWVEISTRYFGGRITSRIDGIRPPLKSLSFENIRTTRPSGRRNEAKNLARKMIIKMKRKILCNYDD